MNNEYVKIEMVEEPEKISKHENFISFKTSLAGCIKFNSSNIHHEDNISEIRLTIPEFMDEPVKDFIDAWINGNKTDSVTMVMKTLDYNDNVKFMVRCSNMVPIAIVNGVSPWREVIFREVIFRGVLECINE